LRIYLKRKIRIVTDPMTFTLPSQHRGFGLIEVLVALLVLSISLLGLAGLQAVSLRSIHGSFVRGQAVLLANDMADRMRANKLGVVDFAGNDVGAYDSANVSGNYQAPANNNCSQVGGTAPGNCTIAQMAAHDAFEWGQALAQRLPGGAGTVCIDSNPADAAPCDGIGGAYAITISWTEIESNGPVGKSYRLRFQP
jgi:type IV pilus assembly protein PilV